MKLLVLALVLLSSEMTLAANRTAICKYYYKQDIFTGYLHLSVDKDQDNGTTLWMDTPTPYGIRAYVYEVNALNCNPEGSLHIEAQSTGTTQKVIFNSKNSNHNGKLEYLNSQGETNLELIMECSLEKIKELCP